jgi:hypothetical protein
MVAYEFYWMDRKGDAHLVGILPERRKTMERIDQRSIINWVRNLLGEDIDLHKIFFVKVIFNEGSGEIAESHPIFGVQEN